jgi:hypothetical protein
MRGSTAVVIALVVAVFITAMEEGSLLLEDPQATAIITPAMSGCWTGEAEIVVNWTRARVLPVRIEVLQDGRVSGRVGDATLQHGRLEANRGALGRALHVKTDWIVRAALSGNIIDADGIRREDVMMPLNWVGDHFEGGVNTSGSHFGGKDSMWLAARDLRLARADVR